MTWIDLGVAKTFLRIDSTDEDALISILIAATQSRIEAYTGLRFKSQSVTLKFDGWQGLSSLPIAPVRSIDAITYTDHQGVEQTLDPSAYTALITDLRTTVTPLRPLPAARSIAITVTAGFGTSPQSIPQAIVHACLLALGDAYAFREDTIAERSVTPVSLPNGVETLLANWRVY